MRHLPTGTITFLFTDIEGSTKWWDDFPDAMPPVLARHDALLQTAIENAGGTVFKTIGDAFCAAFANAPDALQAAFAAQTALQTETWPDPMVLRVRMALHTGTADERGGDYFGPVLNRVARLLASGHGGQTLVSAATYELVRDGLPSGVTLRDLGLHSLKDLERPEHIFQVNVPGLLIDFAPLKTLSNTPNNLPQQLTSFVGREKPLREVQSLLAKTRLLTLTGAGGAGKTRLGLQVAAEILDTFSGGAYLVELAPLADAALVPQTVASALGVKEQAGQTLTQTLTHYLKAKPLLLVLDNGEHVLEACAALSAALLRACSEVRILATSREPLGIAGEQTYRVPSLSLPDAKAAQGATPESLQPFEAVQLFIARAQAVNLDFVVTNQNAPALAQICFRLDGIPLALELAAARTRSLALEQINNKLDTRFRLLTGGDRSALPRQQTLRALVDWSYDLLTDAEKTLFARLSVFAGGWHLEGAERVCGFAPLEDWEVLDVLTSLADKSLVTTQEAGGETRYGLLETLRQYGVEKRDAGGAGSDDEETQTRHLNYFAGFAEDAEPKLTGPEAAHWLNRLEAEHDNIRAAFDWCASAASKSDVSAGLRLAVAMGIFWLVRGYLEEGRERVKGIMIVSQSESQTCEPLMQARGFGVAGMLASFQGDYKEASELYTEKLLINRMLGDKKGIGQCLGSLGTVAHDQGDYVAAQALFEESLTIFRELGDKESIGYSLFHLGNVAHEQGNHIATRPLYEESLAIFREFGNKKSIGMSLNNLGSVAYNQSDYVTAQMLFEESRAIFRELGDRGGIGLSLFNLGNVSHKQEEYIVAKTLYAESLVVFRELGKKSGISGLLNAFASLGLHAKAFHTAAVLWGASEALRESIGTPIAPNEQAEYEEAVQQARSALGEAAFARAWSEGRALDTEQAIEYALQTGA